MLGSILDIDVIDEYESGNLDYLSSDDILSPEYNQDQLIQSYIRIVYADNYSVIFNVESICFIFDYSKPIDIGSYTRLSITKKNYKIIGIRFSEINNIKLVLENKGGCCNQEPNTFIMSLNTRHMPCPLDCGSEATNFG